MYRFLLTLAIVVLFGCYVSSVHAQQCNSGVSTQQAQIQANQALVLQQQAALAARQQLTQAQAVQNTSFVSAQSLLNSFVSAPTCTNCNLASAPIAGPRLVLSNTPQTNVNVAQAMQTAQPYAKQSREVAERLPQRYVSIPAKQRKG